MSDLASPKPDTDQAPLSLHEVRGPKASRGAEISIAVVGGGFCGTLAIISAIRTFETKARELPELRKLGLTIEWFDEGGAFCRGLPYKDQGSERKNSVFLLNQPAKQMSPFTHEPNHFTTWLRGIDGCYDGDSFASRSVYGDFLEALLAGEASRAFYAGTDLRINRRTSRVKEVEQKEDSATITAPGLEAPLTTDAVVLALGHAVQDQFKHLAATPGYIGNPFDLALCRSVLNQFPDPATIVLIGGGATYIDAVRAVEFLRREAKESHSSRYDIGASAPRFKLQLQH